MNKLKLQRDLNEVIETYLENSYTAGECEENPTQIVLNTVSELAGQWGFWEESRKLRKKQKHGR